MLAAAMGDHPGFLIVNRGAIVAMAMVPNGNWLATDGSHGTLQIWDVATCRSQALLRVNNAIFVYAWLCTWVWLWAARPGCTSSIFSLLLRPRPVIRILTGQPTALRS